VNQIARVALESTLRARILRADPVAAGCVARPFRVRLDDGRDLFVKTRAGADPAMFPAEARGLRWLAQAPGGLPVPAVIAATPTFLALDFLSPGDPGAIDEAATDEAIGRGLAALHRATPTGWGLDHDNFIGPLPQANAPTTTWATFWRDRRLVPQLQRARDQLPARLRRDLDHVCDGIEALVGPPEPPARLHGDLWGGNLHVDTAGQPWLIDPAAYGGHREVDLAMMRLFGGFSSRVFAAYAEAWPLSPGAEERAPLYQLYYLLVHVNLFGAGYIAGTAAAVRALRLTLSGRE
jgi:fructosamine-3-kinase